MILFRNRLIIGLILRTIKVFFTVIYGILEFLNLQYTLLVGLIGVVLYFTGALDSNRIVLIIFCLVLVISVVYALIASIKKLLGLDKKVKRSKGVQMLSNSGDSVSVDNINRQSKIEDSGQGERNFNNNSPTHLDRPRYYRVKQNPSYVMAEYSDRYELYKLVNGKLVKIRTDYKTKGDNDGRFF